MKLPTAVPGSRALSSVHGKIELILLCFPNLANNPLEVHDRYAALFRALPKESKFAIIVQYSDSFRSAGSISKYARTVQEVICGLMYEAEMHPKYLESIIIDPLVDYKLYHRRRNIRGAFKHTDYLPSEWAQDPFLVLKRSPDEYALLEPVHFANTNIYKLGDQLVADYVAAQLDFMVKPFALQLEGGNVLVGDRYVLLGSEILYKNWLYFRKVLSFEQITNHFRWTLGIETIIWIGADDVNLPDYTGREERVQLLQKLRHIDMFITLGGKTQDGEDLVFVANLTEESSIAVTPALRKAFNTYFDRVADLLRGYNNGGIRFKVERLPLLLYNVGDRVFMSFNNCLVEEHEHGKFAYLPHYDADTEDLQQRFEDMENLAIETFRRNNFHVTSIPENFSVRARSNGSLHCMAKVLKRSDYGNVGRSPDLQKPDSLWIDEQLMRDLGILAAFRQAPWLLAGDYSSHFR